MSSFSSDVIGVYRTAAAGSASTRYEVVSGKCWFRGLVFYVNGRPGTESLMQVEKQCFHLNDGDTATSSVRIGVGAQFTMSQFMIPDESYIQFENGIWISSPSETVIDNLFLTVFYSQ